MWSLHFHLLSKLKTSKFEMKFVFVQSFFYCYLLSKCKACIVFASSLNAHLVCCFYLCYVSKHKRQECFCYSFLVLVLHCYCWSSFHNHGSYLHKVFSLFFIDCSLSFFLWVVSICNSFVLYFWWMGFCPWFFIQCFFLKVLVFVTWKQTQFVHTLKSSIKQ